MSKKIIGTGLLLAAMVIITMFSCTKTTTLIEDNTPAVTKTVSFSKDIVPIFAKSCAISGCHSGTISPNLSATLAYSTLKSGNFINLSAPSSSTVYLWLTGKEAATMPLGATNNPSNVNGLVLAWIKQGAANN